MNPIRTELKPLSTERAHELFGMLRAASGDPDRGLQLDDQGRALRVAPVTEADVEHLLGDLDVHA